MKIIVLGTRGFPNIQGGVEKHCEELYPRLAAFGCDVTVFGRAPYTGPAPYQYEGVTVIPLHCPKSKYGEAFIHTFLGIVKAKQIQCDILHVHAVGPSLFVPLARALGLRVVMTHHGPDYERKKWNRFAKMILKFGEWLGVTCAHRVIVISRSIADSVHRKFAREVTVIPNGVTAARRVEGNGMLTRYGLDRGRYILAVGRLVPEKGFDGLLESFKKFSSASNDGWKLVIAGDADHEDKFSRELKKKSRSIPNVVLTGFLNGKSLGELYSHAGLFVLPSSYEGLPIALLEALSYGIPCLVSDISSNREIGLEEERYFRPGNIPLLARKFQEFLGRPPADDDRSGWSKRIEEKYSWNRIAQRTSDLYKSVLDETK